MKYKCRECGRIINEDEILYEYIGDDKDIPFDVDYDDDDNEVTFTCPYCGYDDLEPYYEKNVIENFPSNDNKINRIIGILLLIIIIIFVFIAFADVVLPMLAFLLILFFLGYIK